MISQKTKFARIADQIKNQVFSEARATDGKLPSEVALAKRYNTSAVTIGKALASLQSQGLINRVSGVGTFLVDESAKASPNLESVGMVMQYLQGHLDLPFHLAAELQHSHHVPCLLATENRSALESFIRSEPYGLIAEGNSTFPYDLLDGLSDRTKLVFVTNFEGDKHYDASYILRDHLGKGRMAVNHLLKLGRRRILVINFEMHPKWSSTLFWQGCCEAFEEAGIKPVAHLVKHRITPAEYDKYLQGPDRIDGVVAVSDSLLLPLLEVVRGMSLRIPEDIALIGAGNTAWSQHFNLTTFDFMDREVARQVACAMETSKRIFITMTPRMVIRDSCPAY